MRLNEIQTRFKGMMLAPETDDALADILETSDIPLTRRMDVYRNNVMSGLGNALSANFPLLEKLVGRDFLSSMVRAYIVAHPPTSGCLTFYGHDFDQFVADFSPAAHLPYLADMAKLEILGNQSYHAKDDEALSAQNLADIPADRLEELELKLRESVYLLQSPWPLHAIRAYCLDDKMNAPDIHSGGTCLLVHRLHFDVEIVEISVDEYKFLNALKAQPLGQAVVETLTTYPDFDFENTLQRCMKLQLFLKPGKN
ncbi:MAG TPA: DNA-binding domain-containing protein [Alphaproteobacteria bacterium]|mgnify:CR=1 FL=1|nr:putative DNA-binding domain-containing protein [Micavibrio sp.]MBK9561810.1 putative DNA-binding domain-containing protein [Micavibrio sp.]HQX27110.1 DNA-binding domain-containing protein [Alphaproteobacteria bacterium]